MTYHSRVCLPAKSHAALSGCYTSSVRTCSPGVLTSKVFSFSAPFRRLGGPSSYSLDGGTTQGSTAAEIWSLKNGKISWTLASLLTPLVFFALSVNKTDH